MINKFYKKISSIFIFIFTLSSAQIENANTLLWEVSGGDTQKPSYVFGTFHMMCKEDYQLKEKVERAIQNTQNFVMEVDFSNPEQMVKMQSLLMSKNKLTDSFSEKEKELFQENLSHFGYSIEDIDSFSEIAVYSMLSMKLLNCEPKDLKMIDLELMQKALKKNKNILGLETVEEQSQVFNEFLTKKTLLQFVSDFENLKKQMNELLHLYSNEELFKLQEMMEKFLEISPKQKEILLEKRNKKWLQEIPNIIKEKPSFFAVGAGHLLGENGILSLLKQKGYTIKPILE